MSMVQQQGPHKPRSRVPWLTPCLHTWVGHYPCTHSMHSPTPPLAPCLGTGCVYCMEAATLLGLAFHCSKSRIYHSFGVHSLQRSPPLLPQSPHIHPIHPSLQAWTSTSTWSALDTEWLAGASSSPRCACVCVWKEERERECEGVVTWAAVCVCVCSSQL
jgi:hypothetical protein